MVQVHGRQPRLSPCPANRIGFNRLQARTELLVPSQASGGVGKAKCLMSGQLA